VSRVATFVLAVMLLPWQRQEVMRNPRRLAAVQLLTNRQPGAAPRVRFEWDQVAGTREYLLTGRWTKPPSWAVQSGEYRVTRRIATSWDAQYVQFDLWLPEGHHSWRIVALFGPRGDAGDFANPTLVSFDIR
jgi:hypothetical protein